ncbi:GTPase Era, partial [Treponema pallidum]
TDGASPRSGVSLIIGRPSSGKSTFLNAVCGYKVSIVSPIPQTTRNTVRGIVNIESDQIVFMDTPGYHRSDRKFNLRLQSLVHSNVKDADVLLYLVDATRQFGEEEAAICALLAPYQKTRVLLAFNKVDVLHNSTSCDEHAFLHRQGSVLRAGSLGRALHAALPHLPADRVFTISALHQVGLDALMRTLRDLLPEAAPLYPQDCYTDQTIAFRVTELIREQAIARCRDELPHALYAGVEDMELRRGKRELWCRAFLAVERESQKAVLVGKKGAVIRAIRLDAIRALRTLLPYHISLDIRVKVDRSWRQRDHTLSSLLY